MKFRTILLSLCLLLLCAPSFAQKSTGNAATEKKLAQLENEGWQDWKDKKYTAFDQFLTPDSVNITGSMSMDKAAIIKDMQTGACDVKSFSLSDINFHWLDKNSVLMIYTAQQDATCGGNKVPEKVWATSLWQNKGGKWMTPFHQETPAH
ncbi:MAG: hypothetical protein NVS9B15_04580 [Acidobacteriaceae bacterium]